MASWFWLLKSLSVLSNCKRLVSIFTIGSSAISEGGAISSSSLLSSASYFKLFGIINGFYEWGISYFVSFTTSLSALVRDILYLAQSNNCCFNWSCDCFWLTLYSSNAPSSWGLYLWVLGSSYIVLLKMSCLLSNKRTQSQTLSVALSKLVSYFESNWLFTIVLATQSPLTWNAFSIILHFFHKLIFVHPDIKIYRIWKLGDDFDNNSTSRFQFRIVSPGPPPSDLDQFLP